MISAYSFRSLHCSRSLRALRNIDFHQPDVMFGLIMVSRVARIQTVLYLSYSLADVYKKEFEVVELSKVLPCLEDLTHQFLTSR